MPVFKKFSVKEPICSLHPKFPICKCIFYRYRTSEISSNHGHPAQPPALLVVWITPLRGSLWFRLKAGPGKPVPFVTGSRLKAAYSFLTLKALLPVDPSHIAHLYTF